MATLKEMRLQKRLRLAVVDSEPPKPESAKIDPRDQEQVREDR